MKLTLPRETLLNPLQLVVSVVEHKQALPILANVLIRVDQQQLSITGTDCEIELIGLAKLQEPVPEPIVLTLPGRKLLEICRALPDNAVIQLSEERQKIILRSGRSRYTLATLSADDFPEIEQPKSVTQLTLPQGKLRYLLQRTHFAMAQQDVRYYLNGLLLEFLPDTVHAVATDGHRLAFNAMSAAFSEQHRLRVIIPRKGVLELTKLLHDSVDEVAIEISHSYIRLATDEYVFTSKLIEGRFPDYLQAIPRDKTKKVSLDRERLKQAVSRSAILSNEKFRAVYLDFKPNLLCIHANNQAHESAEEEIVIDYAHDEVSVGFNVSYLLDVLSTLKKPDVELSVSGNGSSILIEEPDTDDSAFVIMPMRM